MRKFFLSIAFATLLCGTLAVSSADAQWRRGRGYYNEYPAPVYSYPAPAYSYYYSPDYVDSGPAYYYDGPVYYRSWRGYRGRWR